VTALPGLLMGIPFPAGLRLLGRTAPGLIPWAWTVNGAVSVLAPLLAIMTAMAAGFRGVLLLGATTYFLAAILLVGSPCRMNLPDFKSEMPSRRHG
jgi:hypothetical protein